MIATPIALLPSLGLETFVGLSSDDPMGTRWSECAFGVHLTRYQPRQTEMIGILPPKSRKEIILPAHGRDELVLVERRPGQAIPSDAAMLRSCVIYRDRTGAEGRVIYEQPPRWNTAGKPSTTLTTIAWIQTGPKLSTTVVLLYGSSDSTGPRVEYNYQFRNQEGERIRFGCLTLPLQSVRTITMEPEKLSASYSFIGSCPAASVIVLVITQHLDGGVTVEHTQPGHAAMLPGDPRLARKYKDAAVQQWSLAHAG